ncbi:MAG: glucosaminidase domain-containing protein [Candidatus Levybacteria bacterium]|nr:glucosaminidase domain-containing protein [Candidatus Levybacteria bacterium]
MKNLFYLIIFIITITAINVKPSYAAEISAGSSAALLKPVAKEPDSRVKILREYLGQYDSPLQPYAQDFVEIADKYGLDWKLVAAISGVESTFGKQIPYQSFNGWGWGIYGTNMIRFSSWTQGIETVSEGLRTNYLNKWEARDVYEIGRFYAASPTWAQRVDYFMRKIDELKNQKLAQNLSISL